MRTRSTLPLLAALAFAACNSSTGPDQNLTGNWAGSWYTTIPLGPTEPWLATLTQTGTAVSGSLVCEGLESYTVTGSNVHNALSLTLVGAISDTAHFNGTASDNSGVTASGTFSDDDGEGCFTGVGNWTGRIQ